MTNSKKKEIPKFCLRMKLDIGEDAVDQYGSISAAARNMGINYRRAWFLLETMNTALGQPVALTTKGGSGGGGARLTDAGPAVLIAYENCARATDKSTYKILSDLQLTLASLED